MKPDDVSAALRPVADAFDRLGVRYYVGGSIASSVRGAPRAEDVVFLKLEWFRAGGEVSDRQWGDILGVLRAMSPTIDRDYMSRWASELGVADLLDRALAAADAG